MDIETFLDFAFNEDLKDPTGVLLPGDHTSMACIPDGQFNRAKLVAKESGIIAGTELAIKIFAKIDPSVKVTFLKKDGDRIHVGDEICQVEGDARSILTGERLVLNFMQRMSGIATLTKKFVKKIDGTGATILDTRKTTPNFRHFEKWAVRIGGGQNHRHGLYDMIMIKDNHIDFSGGNRQAIKAANNYLKVYNLDIKIEIEARSLDDVAKIIEIGGVDRILLDNFAAVNVGRAVELINKKFETEVSGGITLTNIREYAEAGVDYISVGALTHSYTSLDLSLQAI